MVLIDHPSPTYDAAAAFWADVAGVVRSGPRGADDDPYETLTGLGTGPLLEVQRTGEGTPPRIHLDIETDDVEAEVDRVLALGARIVERREGYVVLADPGGLVFCVVGVQTDPDYFAAHAHTWK